jgi:hypothetical protein
MKKGVPKAIAFGTLSFIFVSINMFRQGNNKLEVNHSDYSFYFHFPL